MQLHYIKATSSEIDSFIKRMAQIDDEAHQSSYIIIQQKQSELDLYDLLSSKTLLPVVIIKHKMKITEGKIYICPHDKNLITSHDSLLLTDAIVDVSDSAQELALQSRKEMKKILENFEVGLIYLDEDLRIKDIYGNIECSFSLSKTDKLKNIFELDFGKYLMEFKQQLQENKLYTNELSILSNEGVYYRCEIKPWFYSKNSTKGFILVLQENDLDQRIKMFQEVEEEDAQIGAWSLDIASGRTRWSKQVFSIYEIEDSESPDYDSAIDFYVGADKQKLIDYVGKCIEGHPFVDTFNFLSLNGKLKRLRVTGRPVVDKDNVIKTLRGTVQDISDVKNNEDRTSYALEVSSVGIWDLNLKTKELFWDDVMYRLYGLSRETVTLDFDYWIDCVHHEDRVIVKEALGKAIEGIAPFDIYFRIVTPKEQIRYLHGRAKRIGDQNSNSSRVVGANTDITELKEQEEKLLLQQEIVDKSTKLALLGELSSSLGHEINNPLAIVSSGLAVLERKLEKLQLKGEVERTLLSIGLGVSRIENLVRGLKTYSNFQTDSNVEFDVNEIIQESIDLVEALVLKSDCEISKFLCDDVFVKGDSSAFNQVIVNLISNALDAIKLSKVKKIHIKTEIQDDYVFISVEDSGEGILDENRTKVFDHFYTTKEVGEGTGIGLSISHSIVQGMDGDIKVLDADLLGGALFRIKLPILNGDENKSFKSLTLKETEYLGKIKILVLSESLEALNEIKSAFNEFSPFMISFTDYDEALKAACEQKFDLLVCEREIKRGGGTFFETLQRDSTYSKDDCIFISKEIPKFQIAALKKIVHETLVRPLEQKKVLKILMSLLQKVQKKEYPKTIETIMNIADDFSHCMTIVDMNISGRPCIYVNDYFEKTTGYRKDYAVGQNLSFLQGKLTSEESIKSMKDTFNEESACFHDVINYRKDGKPFLNRLVMLPLKDNGKLYYLGFQHDITELKGLHYSEKSIKDTPELIRHTINNSLTKIIGTYSIKVRKKGLTDEIKKELFNKFEDEYQSIKEFILNIENEDYEFSKT